MRIKSIHLSDYKRFTDLTISDIPNTARLVVLIGPNGSGKSSLFDAFLLKSWGSRSNYALSGNREYEGYYRKTLHAERDSTGRLADSIDIECHADGTLTRDEWATAFNIRSAYRNEADFRVNALQAVQRSHEAPRFQRIIDQDQSVSDNYRRLAWKRMSDLDKDEPGSTRFDQYRRESLADLQNALRELFTDPGLELQDFGGIQDSGTFRFSKGEARDFHYKNLSGGEKAAFDLLLDIFVKRSEYKDAIYCIDEPEAHIATSLHGPLLMVVLGLIPEASQLWIATHSVGFVRQAFELMKIEGNVVFLDFSGHDFDRPVVLRPQVPDRAFWQMTYQVALDDISDLIAPENIVICEGDKDGADKGFDAACYNKLFSDDHPETLFISYGSASEVANSTTLMNILGAVTKGVNVRRLIDRDDMTHAERDSKIRDGLRVLKRRELENYLYDPEVLRTFLKKKGMDCLMESVLNRRKDLLDNSSMPNDVKSVSRELFQYIRLETRIPDLGNKRDEFALEHLIPAVMETPSVFEELMDAIF